VIRANSFRIPMNARRGCMENTPAPISADHRHMAVRCIRKLPLVGICILPMKGRLGQACESDARWRQDPLARCQHSHPSSGDGSHVILVQHLLHLAQGHHTHSHHLDTPVPHRPLSSQARRGRACERAIHELFLHTRDNQHATARIPDIISSTSPAARPSTPPPPLSVAPSESFAGFETDSFSRAHSPPIHRRPLAPPRQVGHAQLAPRSTEWPTQQER